MAAKKKSSKKKAPAKKKSKGGRPPKGSGPSKSDFIRDKIEAGLSAAEIVKAGADQKMTIAPAFIYELESRMGAGGGKKAAATGAKPGPKPKDDKLSASDFVRQHPDKPASEVVELAKKAGIKVNAGLVYTVRAYDEKRGSGGGAGAPKGKPGPKPKGTGPKILTVNFEGSAIEEQFRAFVGKSGIDRVVELVDQARGWQKVLGVG